MDSTCLLAFGMPGTWEWIIIGGIALLIFGKRLPEVGRSLGKGIVEFKRGIKGIEEEIDSSSSESESRKQDPAPTIEAPASGDGSDRRVSQGEPAPQGADPKTT